MREIKFRAWSKDTAEMIPWEEGMFPEWFESPEIEVMQYTGLKDKNDKEIYEGDITRRYWDDGSMEDGVIIFENAQFLWAEIKGTTKFIHKIGINTAHSEIIGNIHENPEYLS